MAAAKVMRGECSIEDIKFHNPEDGNYYGKPVVRQDALGKVCGLTDYGDDQRFWLSILRKLRRCRALLRLSQQKILSQQAEPTSWLRVSSMREVLL